MGHPPHPGLLVAAKNLTHVAVQNRTTWQQDPTPAAITSSTAAPLESWPPVGAPEKTRLGFPRHQLLHGRKMVRVRRLKAIEDIIDDDETFG